MADDVLLSVHGTDYLGKAKTTLIYFANGTTLADVTTFAQAFAPIEEGVSECMVTSLEVRFPIALPGGLKANAGAGVRRNAGAVFSFDTPGRYNFGLWIPGIKTTLLTGNEVDLTDDLVVALTNALTSGLSGVVPKDGFGADVGAIQTGRFAYRK